LPRTASACRDPQDAPPVIDLTAFPPSVRCEAPSAWMIRLHTNPTRQRGKPSNLSPTRQRGKPSNLTPTRQRGKPSNLSPTRQRGKLATLAGALGQACQNPARPFRVRAIVHLIRLVSIIKARKSCAFDVERLQPLLQHFRRGRLTREQF